MHVRLQRIREMVLDRHLPMIDSVVDRNTQEVETMWREDYKSRVKAIYEEGVDAALRQVNAMHESKEFNLDR